MKISVNMAISLDGFIARKDGDVSWLDEYHEPSGEDYGFGAFFASIDCMVMGRKTFEKVLSFGEWAYADKQIFVLSRGEVAIPDELRSTVECQSGSPVEIVKRLDGRGFQHLYLDGGETIRGFLKSGLIDSLTLTRVPILLGSGISLFGEFSSETRLVHLTTRHFESGLVQSEYRLDGEDSQIETK